MRTHNAEKPFVCQYEGCGQAFSLITQLQNHIRSHVVQPYTPPSQPAYTGGWLIPMAGGGFAQICPPPGAAPPPGAIPVPAPEAPPVPPPPSDVGPDGTPLPGHPNYNPNAPPPTQTPTAAALIDPTAPVALTATVVCPHCGAKYHKNEPHTCPYHRPRERRKRNQSYSSMYPPGFEYSMWGMPSPMMMAAGPDGQMMMMPPPPADPSMMYPGIAPATPATPMTPSPAELFSLTTPVSTPAAAAAPSTSPEEAARKKARVGEEEEEEEEEEGDEEEEELEEEDEIEVLMLLQKEREAKETKKEAKEAAPTSSAPVPAPLPEKKAAAVNAFFAAIPKA